MSETLQFLLSVLAVASIIFVGGICVFVRPQKAKEATVEVKPRNTVERTWEVVTTDGAIVRVLATEYSGYFNGAALTKNGEIVMFVPYSKLVSIKLV